MNGLFEKFTSCLKTGTPAERRLARYYLEHPNDISFETAASVADRLDLSPMTVGRFLRSMQIENFPLQPVPHNGTAAQNRVLAQEMPPLTPGLAEKGAEYHHLRTHLESLQQVHALASQPLWRDVIDHLSRPTEIFLTSHGLMQPMAAYFSLRLGEIRAGVRHLSGGDGTYLDLLGSRRDDCLLVVLDDPMSSQRLKRLCRAARDEGHRVMLFSGAPTLEMDGVVDLAVPGPTLNQSHSMDAVALTAMIELAVAGVGAANGPFATERSGRAQELHRIFSDGS